LKILPIPIASSRKKIPSAGKIGGGNLWVKTKDHLEDWVQALQRLLEIQNLRNLKNLWLQRTECKDVIEKKKSNSQYLKSMILVI